MLQDTYNEGACQELSNIILLNIMTQMQLFQQLKARHFNSSFNIQSMPNSVTAIKHIIWFPVSQYCISWHACAFIYPYKYQKIPLHLTYLQSGLKVSLTLLASGDFAAAVPHKKNSKYLLYSSFSNYFGVISNNFLINIAYNNTRKEKNFGDDAWSQM